MNLGKFQQAACEVAGKEVTVISMPRSGGTLVYVPDANDAECRRIKQELIQYIPMYTFIAVTGAWRLDVERGAMVWLDEICGQHKLLRGTTSNNRRPRLVAAGAACRLCREFNEYAEPGAKEDPYTCWQCRNGR